MMIRTPEFKYGRYDDGGAELYDLKRDPDELENRVDDPHYRETVAALGRQLDEWDRRATS